MFFLAKAAIGLDVDDSSLELVELQRSASCAKVVASSRIEVPRGVIVNGIVKDEASLSELIKQLLAEAKPKPLKAEEIVFGVPHSQLYPALVEVAVSEEKQLVEDIWQAAYQNLPVEADDLLLEYKVLDTNATRSRVLLLGASKKCLLAWQRVLTSCGLKIAMLDISAYALWRDLALDDREEGVLIVDMGASKTNIFVFNQGALHYSYDFDIGGNKLTDKIAEKYQLSFELAEAKKIKLGLSAQIFPVLESVLYEFSKEIASAIIDYQVKTGEKLTELKLLGGSAKLKGLLNYLQEKLPISSSLGSSQSLPLGSDVLFLEAAGLALRALRPEKYKNDPLLSLEKVVVGKTEVSASLLDPVLDEALEDPKKVDADLGSELVKKTKKAVDLPEAAKKFNLEKKLLALILLIGLIAVAGTYWYRSRAKAEQLKSQAAPAVVFSEIQSFPYKITVALEDAAYTEGLVHGRIVNDEVSSGNDFNEVVNVSRRKIASELRPEEELWTDPLNEVIDQRSVTYPLTFRWLALNKQELVKLALAQVDKLNTDKVPYEFNAITKTKIEKTDSLDKVYLYGEISVSLNQKITNSQIVDLSSLSVVSTSVSSTTSTEAIASSTTPEAGTSTTSQSASASKVLITKTETGWLNVRAGAGKNFEIVTKIYPGESYNYLKQDGEWLQIELSDGKLGWILAKYAKISE